MEVDLQNLPVYTCLHPENSLFPALLWLRVETVVPWLPEEGGRHAAGNDLAAALGQVPRALGRGAGGGGLRGLRGLCGLEAPLVPSATGPEDGALAMASEFLGWQVD